MFPVELDGAKVLYYTLQDNYSVIKYQNGEIADYCHYLAICHYPDEDAYYLFCCNKNYEVIFDWLDCSIEGCMKLAASYNENIIWYQAE